MESPAVTSWSLFVHPLFEARLEKLAARVERLVSKDPRGYSSHPAAKILATINHCIQDVIPRDPNSPAFRQGNALGPGNRHWFRAKFHGRYRLFYRFSTQQKFIIYAWVHAWGNDGQSLRKSGARTDPYAVFQAMLKSGEPPNSLRNSCEPPGK
jgi:toxin YhaV